MAPPLCRRPDPSPLPAAGRLSDLAFSPMATASPRSFLHLLFLPSLMMLAATPMIALAGSSPPVKFTPTDNYLLNCGAPKPAQLPDGRTFKSDPQSLSFLSTTEDIKIFAPATNATANASLLPFSLLYGSARVFPDRSTYSFFISKPGHHWVRLHFFAFPNPDYNLTSSVFSVTTDDLVLLHDLSPISLSSPVLKEYLISIETDRASLIFTPAKGSMAFINAVEVVSAPDSLIQNAASGLSPQRNFAGLSGYDYEISRRVNIGGPSVYPQDDSLTRLWESDLQFLRPPTAAKNVSIPAKVVRYPDDGSVTPLIAPPMVYSTADVMADTGVADANFNVTWELAVDPKFSYLVRLHFCDIISKTLNDLFFNVYINGLIGVSSLDLSAVTSALSVAYFKDFVVNSSSVVNSTVRIQVGPTTGSGSGAGNAILNGFEVMKMSNDARSLDGLYSVDGSYHGVESAGSVKKVVAIIGLSMAVLALAFVGTIFCRWKRRPADWERRGSFSSWLLPIHATQNTFTSSCSKTGGGSNNRRFGSRKSKSGHSSFFSSGALGLGRYFTFAELQEATKNFDEKAVIGVGGFGKVYIAELEDGTKIAVKRGNPSSEQGINEFQTEIQMLSRLRHRHLVSLMGYCDENNEMILVYEFMSNGPLRDHLYGGGSEHKPLSWKQRLDICIGAARGLHYLHTGATQGIIHRDVKTTNILLDESLVAKVADFGLSKAAPSMEQTHISTAVKGSFGYLDPEYFRRQQLTEKSDVYSFGVVLFEVLCARPAINTALPRDQVNLAEWAMQWHRKGAVEKIVDPHLAGSVSPASLKKFVEAAEKCLADCGVDRPSMGDVLWNLEYALQLQEAAMGQAADDEDGVGSSAKCIPMIPLARIDEDDGGSESAGASDEGSAGADSAAPRMARGR